MAVLEGTTLISYKGIIKYETIGELIHNFKQQVPLLGIPMGIYKRILLIMIESLENIMKHSETPEPSIESNLPELSIMHHDNKYIIETSNPLCSSGIAELKKKIDFLNNMDQQGLKSLYKETITDGVFTKRGGAGLGLIEIAKISCNVIQYEFKAINRDYTRYSQRVTVSKV